MTYGMKRWAMGELFGALVMAAGWAVSYGNPAWVALAGGAIVAFFADCLIDTRTPRQQGTQLGGREG